MAKKEGEGTKPAVPTSVDATKVEGYKAPKTCLSEVTTYQHLQQYEHSTSTEHSAGTLAHISGAIPAATLMNTSMDTKIPNTPLVAASLTKIRYAKLSEPKEAERVAKSPDTTNIATGIVEYTPKARGTINQNQRKCQHSTSTGSLSEILVKPLEDNSAQTKLLTLRILELGAGAINPTLEGTTEGISSTWFISFTAATLQSISAATKEKLSNKIYELTLQLIKKQVAAVISAMISEDTMTTFESTIVIKHAETLSTTSATEPAASSAAIAEETLPDFTAIWHVMLVTILPEPIALEKSKLVAQNVNALTLPALRRQLLAAIPARAKLSCSVNMLPGFWVEIVVIEETKDRAALGRLEQEAKEEATTASPDTAVDTDFVLTSLAYLTTNASAPSSSSTSSPYTSNLIVKHLQKAKL